MHISLRYLAVGLIALLSQSAIAAMTVGVGATVDFGDAAVDFGCGDVDNAGSVKLSSGALADIRSLTNSGSFLAGAARISLGADFSNTGNFSPSASRVDVGDTCGSGVSKFAGATNFYDLYIDTHAGKQVSFAAGVPQGVAHALSLLGAPGALLKIVSDSPGRRGVLAVAAGASQLVSYVDARDNDASVAHIAPGAAANYLSVDSGNLSGWFDQAGGVGQPGGDVEPAPALGWGRWLLLALIVLVVRRKRSQPN
jgi:hypothetical protein